MINLSILKPSIELSNHIRRIFIVNSREKIKHQQKVVSNPFVYLSFVPNKAPLPFVNDNPLPIENKLYLTGPIVKNNVVLEYSGKIDHLFFEFTTLGFYSLFHISPISFIDDLLPFSSLVSKVDYQNLCDDLIDKKNIEEQKTIIEKFFSKKIKKSLPTNSYLAKSLEIIEKHKGYLPIKNVAEQINVCERQLRRKFKEVVGLSPKKYCEILNTHYIISCMQNEDYKSIQDLAYNSEYYDLAHFCNRFKKNIGFKPTEFINNNTVDFSKTIYS